MTRTVKKRIVRFVTRKGKPQKAFYILIPLMLFNFYLWPGLLAADTHKRRENHDNRYVSREERLDHWDNNTRRVKKDAEGNETTGQTTAWLLMAANLTVAISILLKGANRFLPLDPQMISSFKSFNQLQKKFLMRFHYVLNPVALFVALFHFLLSSCRSSPLPEWGLILVASMVLLGIILKFKLSPKVIRKSIYRIHTTPAFFLITMVLLLVGHLFVD